MKFSKLVLKNTNIFLNRNLNYDFYVKKYIHTSFSLKNTSDGNNHNILYTIQIELHKYIHPILFFIIILDEFRVIDLKNKQKNQFPERRKQYKDVLAPPRFISTILLSLSYTHFLLS